jgi:hypothetical protein
MTLGRIEKLLALGNCENIFGRYLPQLPASGLRKKILGG